MDYRYQETLSWIIPGFYFLFYLSVEILCIFPEWKISETFNSFNKSQISDSIVTLLVFAIPIFSFITGWILNGYAGYLFRHIMKSPTTSAYNDVYGKDETGNPIEGYVPKNDIEAERVFDQARRSISLETVDRFYYRYVASRNMFFAQMAISILSVFFVTFAFCTNLNIATIWLIVSLILLEPFSHITARDLNTHARYVYIEFRKTKVAEETQE